jgi:hypothetical protein
MTNKPNSESKYILEACEKASEKVYVDENYYQQFTNISDDKLRPYVQKIIKQYSEQFNKIVAIKAPNGENPNHTNMLMVEEMLSLLFHGRMSFDADNKISFCKPIGNPPTNETNNLLSKRVKSAVPIIYEALGE